MLSVDLPYPPTTNNLFFNVKGKGRVKSTEYRAWLEEAGWLVKAAITQPVIDGPYGLHVLVGRKDKRKRDLSNMLKPLEDVLVSAGAVRDDSDCERIEMEWRPSLQGVRVIALPTRRAE